MSRLTNVKVLRNNNRNTTLDPAEAPVRYSHGLRLHQKFEKLDSMRK